VVPQRAVPARKNPKTAIHRFGASYRPAWVLDRTVALGPRTHPGESFVFSELSKATAWAKERVSLFHYRDKDKLEVDFVLENVAGQIAGVEVKAAASVTRRDFAGLERVASAAGAAFVQGILLYDGDQVLTFGENLRAAPLSTLWG
jgi:uncharacterized protein